MHFSKNKNKRSKPFFLDSIKSASRTFIGQETPKINIIGKKIVRSIEPEVIKRPTYKRKIILPLYFGWEIELILQRVKDWRTKFFSPFKKYWHYISLVGILIIITTTFLAFKADKFSNAATYSWVQTLWSATSTNTAIHPTNQSGWSDYFQKDPNLVIGNDLQISTTSTSTVQTTDQDFNTGTKNATRVTGTGEDADITLATISLIKPPTLLGTYDTIGFSQDAFVSGNYTYIADRWQGVQIINTSSSTNPTFAGAYYPPGWTNSVFVVGNFAYVADNGLGLTILDVSNPANPSYLGSFNATTTALGVFVSGNYAYLSVSEDGLNIIDISDPANPFLVGMVDTPGNAQNSFVVGNYAYVADYGGGFQVIDVSVKSNPSIVASLGTSRAYDIYVYNDKAYIADDESGLVIIDITNPLSPIAVGSYNTEGNAFGVYVSGNYAFVADNNRGLQIVDVASSTAPALAGNYDTPGNSYGVFFNSGKAYVADYASGLKLIDVSFISSLRKIGGADTPGSASEIFVLGDYAYIADSDQGLRVMDISDPAYPVETGFYDTSGSALGVYVENNYAYIADDTGGLVIVGTSNPASPALAGSYATSSAKNVVVSGTYAYIANGDSGLGIINIADPANPSYVGSYDSAGSAEDVVVAGNYAYIADGTNGMVVVDVSDPSNPAYQGIYNTTGSADGIYVSGQYAYIADMTKGIVIVNISNPANPTLTGLYDTTGISHDIYVQGTNAFLADDNSGLQVIDVTDPTTPSLGGTYNTSGIAAGVFVSDRFAYVSDGADGLQVILTAEYEIAGTFTSAILDTVNIIYQDINWNMILPATTTFSIKARSSQESDMAGATGWSSCDTLTNGQNLTDSNCVNDQDRYFQYQLSMATNDNIYSPIFNDLTYSYVIYPYYQSLISSPYDTDNALNIISKVGWTENEQLPSNSGVIMYLRASSSQANLLNTSWQEVASSSSVGFLTPGCSRNTGVIYCQNSVIPAEFKDEIGDQWIQYKVALTTLGSTTPAFFETNLQYVVNMRPQFDADYPGSGEGGSSAGQGTDGIVTINYSVRDPDASLGTFTPYFIDPLFEYSLDNGITWHSIIGGLSSGATSTKPVEESAYAEYSLTWNAKNQIDGEYSTSTRIKVIADDNEGANNTASSVTAVFTLDTKDPVITQAARIVATTTPALLYFSVTDNSPMEMMVSLDSGFSGASWTPYSPTSSIALMEDPETVYGRFKDSYNNIIDLSAITPEAPINAIIRDITNVNTGDYRLFVAWKEVSIPLSQFAAYNVYYSIDNINYAPLTRITNRATNYFLHFNLSDSDTYYYKIAAEDVDGNFSYYSHPIVSDIPNGTGGSDNTPPVISNVTTSTTTPQQAGIVWDTDEPSNSMVEYGILPGIFTSTTTVLTMRDNIAGLGRHQVILTSLTASTTYYYQIKSTDATGNIATANNGGSGYVFNTQDGPLISGVSTAEVTNSGATISWNSDIGGNSYVVYSMNSDLSSPAEFGRDELETAHTVTISGLVSGTDYYYYVKTGITNDDNGGNYYSFRTSSDITAPEISSVAATLITDSAASINWTTDENATSKVEYGATSGNYTASSTNSGYNNDHVINLNGLSANTPYYYRVISIDASANPATSIEYSFSTSETLYTQTEVNALEEAARDSSSSSNGGGIMFVEKIVEKIIDKTDTTGPAITGIKVNKVNGGNIEVEWTTNEDADSFIEFGIKATNENTIGQRGFVKTHKVSLAHLTPQTAYIFRVTSSDQSGNLTRSETGNFITPTTLTGDVDKDKLINSLEKQITVLKDSSKPETKQEKASVAQTAAEALQSAIDLLRKNASSMSSGMLESTLFSQFASIEEISRLFPGPVIVGDPKLAVTADSADIKWDTNKDADSFVAFVTEDKYDAKKSDPYIQVVGRPTDKTKAHQVMLYDLKPDTTYHYQVRSKASIGATRYSKDYTFKTSEEKLEIKDINIQNISHQEASFKWVTTKQTDSQLKYIPYHENVLAVDLTKVKNEKTMTTLHEININDFESGVTYSIEISGKDGKGNSISKTLETFTTSEDSSPPDISTVQTETALSQGKDLKVQAVITWTTNEPSTSKVYYEQGISQTDVFKQETKIDSTYTKKHVVVVTAFEPGAIYRYRVESIDSSGNKSYSKSYTILTPRQKESVFQMIMKNIEDTFGWLGKINGGG